MSATIDFTPLNNFFDNIYVITTERAIVKQERITELFEGLNFQFFVGAYKKDFTIDGLIEAGIYDEKKAIAIHRYDKPMNTGQIGCSWSHRMVYEDMLEKGYKKVLVLEHDVVPQKEGFAVLPDILKELPGDWELLYFDYHKNIKRTFSSFFVVCYFHLLKLLRKFKWSHTTIANLYTKKFSDHLNYAGYHDFTSAYAITPAAAKKLIALQTPIAFQSDNLLAHACSNKLVKGFITLPKVFMQASQLEDKKTITLSAATK
jgi:glycosyl transferase family 25